jgi:beta-mannosidase
MPASLPSESAIHVPDSVHLQPFLYPDRPYWGEHLRAINHKAWIYRRTFRVPPTTFRRARIRFEGVDYYADVWLNDQYLGKHEGNFAPFEFDVTGAIRWNDDNRLMVRVTSPWDAPNPRGSYPIDHVIRGLVKGLYEHGEGVIPPDVNPIGIWRPVSLILDDGVSIDHIRIDTQLDGHINLRLHLTNATESTWVGRLALNIQAENHDGVGVAASLETIIPHGHSKIEHTLLLPDPHLWWPWDRGAADLYRLTAQLVNTDDCILSKLSRVFGIRTVRLERSPERFIFYVNDCPISLRGSSYIPAVYLSQCTGESVARDLTLARTANLNLLRVHVHVSLPELYNHCDRAGMLIWQDFELNWTQDTSPEFEQRALRLQRDMIDLLDHHPSVAVWACHNEPTMIFARRDNLETRPDPALYADATAYDPTRPVFLCSGQMDSDWRRSGDSHWYFGAIWSRRFTDIRRRRSRLLSEFGFEAPAARETLMRYSDVWERLNHLDAQIESLWNYQSALIQYQVEYVRRLRAKGCAGYVHFCLNDLVPQVGCGVLDASRMPKAGYTALKRASQPLLLSLDHDGHHPIALWVYNDTMHAYPDASIQWQIYGEQNVLLDQDMVRCDIPANASQPVMKTNWTLPPRQIVALRLSILRADGTILSENRYDRPFARWERPRGYPWKFDPYLGTKAFDRPNAPSLADHGVAPLMKLIPLPMRETAAEWVLRGEWPIWFQSIIARIADRLLG